MKYQQKKIIGKKHISELWKDVKQFNTNKTSFRRRWGDRISKNSRQIFTKFDENYKSTDYRSSQISKQKDQAQ